MSSPFAVSCVLSCVLLASCASPSPSRPPETLKIVSLLPRTGGAKQQTDLIVNAITLALEECGHEAAGFRILYSDVDTSSAVADRGQALRDAGNAAIEDPDVMACIGTYNSGSAKLLMPDFNREKLLLISPANTWPGLTKPGGDPGEPEKYRPTGALNYCRVVPADDVQGIVAAEWAKKSGVKSVLVIDDRETYGKLLADRFEARAVEIGLDVRGREKFDVAFLIDKIRAAQPDLVYYGGTAQTKAGELARDLASSGMKCAFMVPDACFEQPFIEAAGPESRAWITAGWIPPERLKGKGAAFVAAYRKRHGADPEFYAIYAYDAARAVLEAIRKAGKKDRDAIRAACLSIRNFDGALGRWSFDKNGDTTFRTMSIYGVKDGRFELIDVMPQADR
jgi:branched-chain amino acid transport system substrate-binding protein